MSNPETKTEAVTYELKGMESLPARSFHKVSKYDPIVDSFIASKHPVAEVTVSDIDGGYLVIQLNERIRVREIKGVAAKVVNGKPYLTRELSVKPKAKAPKS